MTTRVLAGLADRPGMNHMLGWAIREAAAVGASLMIVRAEVRRPGVLNAVARGGGMDLAAADPALARAVTTARDSLGDDRVAVVAEREPAGPVLVGVARPDDLIVVGAPTRSGWWGRGSTTYHVMTRASCPVVAVHNGLPSTSDDLGSRAFPGQVLVGVDGSPAAHAALEFGFAYARQHGTPVVAVLALRHPVGDVWFDDQLLETHLGAEPPDAVMLSGEVEPWHLKYPDVPVGRALVGGDPVDALRRIARGAALLVVGTAADRLAQLGTVSRALAESAACPVAVVRVAP